MVKMDVMNLDLWWRNHSWSTLSLHLQGKVYRFTPSLRVVSPIGIMYGLAVLWVLYSVTKFVPALTNTCGGETAGFTTRSSKDSSHIVSSQTTTTFASSIRTIPRRARRGGELPHWELETTKKAKIFPLIMDAVLDLPFLNLRLIKKCFICRRKMMWWWNHKL